MTEVCAQLTSMSINAAQKFVLGLCWDGHPWSEQEEAANWAYRTISPQMKESTRPSLIPWLDDEKNSKGCYPKHSRWKSGKGREQTEKDVGHRAKRGVARLTSPRASYAGHGGRPQRDFTAAITSECLSLPSPQSAEAWAYGPKSMSPRYSRGVFWLHVRD